MYQRMGIDVRDMKEEPQDGKFYGGGAFVSSYFATDMVANDIGETEISPSRESE
jgi:hypothetical protein